jgi:hypothetical protein
MSTHTYVKDGIRSFQRSVKNVYNSMNDAQICVRDATSNSTYRPTRSQLEAVARYADSEYDAVASILFKRLTDYKHRRHVYKALLVIEHLLLRSGEQFVADVVERMDIIRRLKMFKFFKNGDEVGYDVREQATKVMDMLEKFDQLTEERLRLKGSGQRLALPETGYIFGEEGVERRQEPLKLEFGYDNFGQARYEEEQKFAFEDPLGAHEPAAVDAPSEEEQEQEEEMPKKKKGKKLKKKKTRKSVQRDEEGEVVEENQDEDLLQVAPVAEPGQASALDDFLSDLVAQPAAKNEQALVPAASIWENTSKQDAQLGWLSSSLTAPVTNNELALFDSYDAKPAAPARNKSVAEPMLFDMGPAAAPAYSYQPPAPQYHNQWDMSQQLMLEYQPPAAAAPQKKNDDIFGWMN